MSNTDSFIEEVSEEVRRDKLFATFRKYGWVAGLLVAVTVGGAIFNEVRTSRAEEQAQTFGTSVLTALETDNASAQDILNIEAHSDNASALLHLIASNVALNSDDPVQARQLLEQIASLGDAPQEYRDLALFRLLVLPNSGLDADTRRAGFDSLDVAGKSLRLMASEQIALLDIAQGQREEAINRLNAILQDAEMTEGLRQRATQVIVALGETPVEAN